MACMFPITIINPRAAVDMTAAKYIPVPCRKCPPCLSKRSNGWIFRLLQQDKVTESSLFVTLTYSPEHFTKQSKRITEKGYMTLNKRDFQLFIKRLRKSRPHEDKNTPVSTKLRYYAVGEYGSETYRPHYHAIIFNSNEAEITQAWGLGNVHCDIVNDATVAYTTKYMHKGKLIPVHQNDDRTPEFQLLSQGLGASYITPQTIEYHNADINRNYVTASGGYKVPMPDLYKKKIFSETTRHLQARRVQKLILSLEEDKMVEYKSIYGDLSGYYKSQAESKRSALQTFHERQKDRKKL